MVFNDLGYMVDDAISWYFRIIGSWTKHQKRPTADTHQQRDSCLVNSRQALEGYT
jgi:hypothetical protein